MSISTSSNIPQGIRLGNENLIKLTKIAGEKIFSLIQREKKGTYLRVAITGGGCNGLSYKMVFVKDPKGGDIMVQTSGANVIVDSKSALYLKGTQLDYASELISGGFKFKNPNAKSSCSCGESFSL